jgi:hypothetical protein
MNLPTLPHADRSPRHRRAEPRRSGRVLSFLRVWAPLPVLLGAVGVVGTVGVAGTGGAPPVAAASRAPLRAHTVTPTLVWNDLLNDTSAPVAQSSPNLAVLDGDGPSVVVGDRAGLVYAVHLSDGSSVAGWPVSTGAVPIDSTPSVEPTSSGLDRVYVGAGDAFDPVEGGYEAFNANGSLAWYQAVVDQPTDSTPAYGVQASLTVGSITGDGTQVVAGSLDEEEYALQANTGGIVPGWPFWTADSVFSTAAIADLYGNGRNEVIEGGDASAGFGNGQNFTQGGHVRVLNGEGGVVCSYDTDQVMQASPAVGDLEGNGTEGIVIGSGSYWSGASDTDRVLALDSHCNLLWSSLLDGDTASSPDLAPILGNGQLQVAQGTDTGTTGSAWLLNASNGQPIWVDHNLGRVIGGITSAYLYDDGYQDLVVPTIGGVYVLDGRSGAVVATLATDLGIQNSPLITDDADGLVGITVAGYNGIGQGVIRHYELPGTYGPGVDVPGTWPMFHHDPQLTGVAPGGVSHESACTDPSAALPGYQLVASDGGMFSFGASSFCGSMGGQKLNQPIVGMARANDTGGYWLVARDGGIFAFGGARFYGSMGGVPLAAPVVGMAATRDGRGYWLVSADGGIFAFGDAEFYGSAGAAHLTTPVVGVAASVDGHGYRLVTSTGGVLCYGDAQYFGSMGATPLTAPVVGIATDAATGGYWLAGDDGAVYSFQAPFYGSMGGRALASPVVGIAQSTSGYGYWLVAADGGIFSFGYATFYGSMGGRPLNEPILGMAGT